MIRPFFAEIFVMPTKKVMELVKHLNSIRLINGDKALGEEIAKMSTEIATPNTHGYKSAAIRALLESGMTKSEVAQYLSTTYQHVYNVSKQKFKRGPMLVVDDLVKIEKIAPEEEIDLSF